MVATKAQARAIGEKGGRYVAKKLKLGTAASGVAGEIGRRLGGAAHGKAFSYVKKLAGFKHGGRVTRAMMHGGRVTRSSSGRFKKGRC